MMEQASLPPGKPGTYRPQYELGPEDLHQDVVNTIAGEVSTKNQAGVDAVINSMFNRLGTKWYHGQTENLRRIAMAGKGTKGVQYAGYRRASEKEAAFIRSRIQAIASGSTPDITKGAQEFRASYYRGPWARKNFPHGVNIAGNVYAKTADTVAGPYAPYDVPRMAVQPPAGATAGGRLVGVVNPDGSMGQKWVPDRQPYSLPDLQRNPFEAPASPTVHRNPYDEVGSLPAESNQLNGRMVVDLNLAKDLRMRRPPRTEGNMSVKVNQQRDTTGTRYNRPGDPTYGPSNYA